MEDGYPPQRKQHFRGGTLHEVGYHHQVLQGDERGVRARQALSIWRQRRVDAGKIPNALYLLDDPYRTVSDKVYDQLTVNRLNTAVRLSE